MTNILSGGVLLSSSSKILVTAAGVVVMEEQIFPIRATMWHEEAIITAGAGAWSVAVWSYDINQDYIYCPLIDPDNDGDTFTNGCILAEGVYDFYALGAGDANNGKVDWYIDNVLFKSGEDWYTSGPDYNIIMKTSSVSVVGNGRHVLKGVINGKVGISTGFYLPLSKYWFEPASDAGDLG